MDVVKNIIGKKKKCKYCKGEGIVIGDNEGNVFNDCDYCEGTGYV